MVTRTIIIAGFCSMLAACAGNVTTRQVASTDSCHQFALSGGYPYLRGGPINGPNSTIERLPGAPPLILQDTEGGGTNQLDEEQYLETWCERNQA